MNDSLALLGCAVQFVRPDMKPSALAPVLILSFIGFIGLVPSSGCRCVLVGVSRCVSISGVTWSLVPSLERLVNMALLFFRVVI